MELAEMFATCRARKPKALIVSETMAVALRRYVPIATGQMPAIFGLRVFTVTDEEAVRIPGMSREAVLFVDEDKVQQYRALAKVGAENLDV